MTTDTMPRCRARADGFFAICALFAGHWGDHEDLNGRQFQAIAAAHGAYQRARTRLRQQRTGEDDPR